MNPLLGLKPTMVVLSALGVMALNGLSMARNMLGGNDMQTPEEFTKKHGITSETEYGTKTPWEDQSEWQRTSNPWTITLKKGRKRVTFGFWTGTGIKGEPTGEDVLSSVADDSGGFDNARSFEDWAEEYGYDTDSRKAERIYKEVGKNAKKLKGFLGPEAYEELLWHTERM